MLSLLQFLHLYQWSLAFRHWGPVSWKTIIFHFSWMGRGGWFWDDSHILISSPQPRSLAGSVHSRAWTWESNVADLAGGGAQVVTWTVGSGFKYRWSFTHSLTAHHLLWGPVPKRPQTGSSLGPGAWGPLICMMGMVRNLFHRVVTRTKRADS